MTSSLNTSLYDVGRKIIISSEVAQLQFDIINVIMRKKH